MTLAGLRHLLAAALLSAAMVAPATKAEEPATARLGTFYYQLARGELEALGVANPDAAVVVGVFPGTAADQAGIKSGDVIVEFDGKPTRTDNDVVAALKLHRPGDEVPIVYVRRNQKIAATVRLSPPATNYNAEVFQVAQAGQAWAQFNVGWLYYEGKETKQDYVKARYWLGKAADAGVAGAQRLYGYLLENGFGGDVDLAKAHDLYEKAASKGDVRGEGLLAWSYGQGRGCSKDMAKALHWGRKAAEDGDVWAQNAYGETLLNGVDVPRDPKAAAQWFEKAANNGSTEAMASLGLMYETGDGVPQNYAAALRWLKPAADAGLARAQHSLGYLYQYGKGVAKDIATAARLFHAAGEHGYVASQTALAVMYYYDSDPPDYQQALEWATKAAQQNDPRALNLLGTIYNEGRALTRDPVKAFEYTRQAAASGDLVFQYNLGLDYSHGTGVTPDFAEAVRLIQPVADKGVPDDNVVQRDAQDELGQLYYAGDAHLPKNEKVAMFWFEKAARAGHPHAQVVLAKMLSDQKRYAEAAHWFRVAAEKGDSLAQNDLGVMYANGWGVPKSRKDAIAWLLRAYQQGYASAGQNLRKLGVNAQ